jgi:murein L,D-transpeptidase YcbB/YkuD
MAALCAAATTSIAAVEATPPERDPDWYIPRPTGNTRPAAHAQIARLEQALAAHAARARAGGWKPVPPGEPLRAGERDPRNVALRERLRASGDHDGAMLTADPWFFDRNLAAALRRFQARHGLPQSGALDARTLEVLNVPIDARIGQLQAVLERWRWLPALGAPRYVWINTAAATVELIEDGRPVLAMRAIVGHPSRPTPSFASELRAVVFNPTWSVPMRIAVEDLLPRQQEDPGYLRRHGFRAWRGFGRLQREVDLATIDWMRLDPQRFPYRLRQDPGPGNSLGRIKLVMDNPFDIYLHDTPEGGLFGLSSRTLGSGCVRLEAAHALTTRLLAAERGWSEADTAAAIAGGDTHSIALRDPVPVYLVYLTAWVDDGGTVHFRRDSYGWDQRMQAAPALP